MPPPFLLTCAADPNVPVPVDQGDIADYIVDLWAAGDDCRSKLSAIQTWGKGQSLP